MFKVGDKVWVCEYLSRGTGIVMSINGHEYHVLFIKNNNKDSMNFYNKHCLMPAKTIKDLAKDAEAVQNACNLSGVVHSFSKACSYLRLLMNESPEGFSQEAFHSHPIIRAWVSKIQSLTGEMTTSDWQSLSDMTK